MILVKRVSWWICMYMYCCCQWRNFKRQAYDWMLLLKTFNQRQLCNSKLLKHLHSYISSVCSVIIQYNIHKMHNCMYWLVYCHCLAIPQGVWLVLCWNLTKIHVVSFFGSRKPGQSCDVFWYKGQFRLISISNL